MRRKSGGCSSFTFWTALFFALAPARLGDSTRELAEQIGVSLATPSSSPLSATSRRRSKSMQDALRSVRVAYLADLRNEAHAAVIAIAPRLHLVASGTAARLVVEQPPIC